MSLKIFSKCGITLVLFPLILALFFMTGCIEKEPQLLQASSSFGAEDQQSKAWSGQLQMEIDPELKSDLFCVRGNVMLAGNGSLPYLMLNATLSQGGTAPMIRTKYLLMQLEPNRDYGFEIAKNMRVKPGDYNCTLEVSGPGGTLACETRKCSLEKSSSDSDSSHISLPPPKSDVESAGQELARQELREKAIKAERAQPEEIEEKEPSQDVMTEKVSNNDGDSEKTKIEAGIKDEADEAQTHADKIEEDDEDLQAGEVDMENDSSPAELTPVSVSPESLNAMFVGSSTSKKYHLLDCRYALKIKPENRIYFQSPEDAKRQGYLPCKTCNP